MTVSDTGTGIPPDQLERIFEMFTQVDRSVRRAQGGLGIGLTLVRRLVGMHGGSIEARSAGLGKGSEFVVRLPVADGTEEVARAADAELERPVAAGSGSPKPRMLVVDDNTDTALSLATLLEIEGHEVFTAHDGLAAIESAHAHRPDVVLLDIGLPKLDGHEACGRIRSQPWGKKMIVIAVTGWGQDEDRRKSQDAGFDGHLVKPVDYDQLAELLRSLTPR